MIDGPALEPFCETAVKGFAAPRLDAVVGAARYNEAESICDGDVLYGPLQALAASLR